MPTENQSTSTEMVSFPRELSDDLAELIATKARVCGGGAFEIWEAICDGVGKPAEQHQGKPIMLTAVATLVDDGDGGLEPSWLLEGGTAELFAGMTLLVAENAPELCHEDGSAEVYTRADPGEVERLRTALKFYADREHYHFESGNWDTVSGEPLNILWCGDEPDFIEDGSVARAALDRQP